MICLVVVARLPNVDLGEGQFTQVQDIDRKWSVLHHMRVASKPYTLVARGGAYKGGIIPAQKLDSQRGEGAYFQRVLTLGKIQ